MRKNSPHVPSLIAAPVLPATADRIYCDVKFQQRPPDPVARLQNVTGRETKQAGERLDEVGELLTAPQRSKDGR